MASVELVAIGKATATQLRERASAWPAAKVTNVKCVAYAGVARGGHWGSPGHVTFFGQVG